MPGGEVAGADLGRRDLLPGEVDDDRDAHVR
jgi:hypothetical protein